MDGSLQRNACVSAGTRLQAAYRAHESRCKAPGVGWGSDAQNERRRGGRRTAGRTGRKGCNLREARCRQSPWRHPYRGVHRDRELRTFRRSDHLLDGDGVVARMRRGGGDLRCVRRVWGRFVRSLMMMRSCVRTLGAPVTSDDAKGFRHREQAQNRQHRDADGSQVPTHAPSITCPPQPHGHLVLSPQLDNAQRRGMSCGARACLRDITPCVL